LQFHGGDAETLQQNGVIDLLESFRREGRVRYIGVSTKLPQVDGLIDLGVFDTFQLPYSCVEPEHEQAITRAAKSGAGIIIRGGIGKGGPQAEIQRDAVNAVWENANLEELLEDGMLPAELILRYTISHPHCHTTIVGTCNPQHLEANLQAAQKGPLPADLCQEIQRRVANLISRRD
jgi:aryl-alcohol dehydrogenase-like predicted oxidoreductase